ncbi:uncharacterized protein LOC130899740 [Diorhabda carinulata]|uniref:uncharacterized protein LOC130899740 n=1 Tax=Diorhabda carinulata TaxID=1163345 RepID=UPI0025A1CE80|nr:uncharacterized protein LOC130899740 [Diorhabda carinulata]
MDDNISLPLILKYCFKDIKKDAGSENNNISAVCKKCSKTLKGSLISTTNFLNHIKRKGHGDLLTEYENLKSQTKTSKKKKCGTHTDENSASTSKKLIQSTLPTTLPVSINLDKLVIDFIIDTMSPISIVENKSFRTLIEGAQKLQNPPKFMCRRTCNKRIADMCAEYKENLKIKLKPVDYVCMTADVWSSSRRSYLGMTVHWIDPHTFERNSFTLACRRFKGTHTFDKVAELIIDIHTEYHLRVPKITKTVTDNGSNMLKAFKIYGKSELGMDATDGIFFSSSDIENISVNKNDDDHNNNNEHDDDDDETFLLKEFPESQKPEETYQLPNHERCTTHTLHLITSRDIIQARSQNISYKKLHDAAMAKCQAIWNLCSRSPKASEIYCETTGKSPTSPCPTRWNSYYNCIMDLLKVQETLNETLKKLGLSVFKEI